VTDMTDVSEISGFTPGPYFLDPKHPDCVYVNREGEREGVRAILGHTLMKLEHFSDEWPNTAKLFAAAPDMHAEIACLRRENAALVAVIKAVVDRNYPGPHSHRPGKCAHRVYHYDVCEDCIDEFLLAALRSVTKTKECQADFAPCTFPDCACPETVTNEDGGVQ
jgi:hypothetical protein